MVDRLLSFCALRLTTIRRNPKLQIVDRLCLTTKLLRAPPSILSGRSLYLQMTRIYLLFAVSLSATVESQTKWFRYQGNPVLKLGPDGFDVRASIAMVAAGDAIAAPAARYKVFGQNRLLLKDTVVGQLVATGVYFSRIVAGGYTQSKKMLTVK